MSVYNPPTENITSFNTLLFNQPEVILSQSEADLLYLSKSKNDISTASLTTFNGQVNVAGNASVGTNAGSNNLSINGELRLDDTASPYTNYARIYETGTNLIYESPNITAGSFHIFKVWSGGTLSNSLELQNYQIVARLLFSTSDKIELNPTAYSFPYGGASGYKYLGHNFKNTGSAFTTLTTGTPKTILTSAVQIPIGVWRVDFSVMNVVGATGAGTITQAQSYVSRTPDGNVGTAIDATGSVVRSHVSEVYANNDTQVITSSFTLNQSTAGLIYLNIVRSFATGTYSFTGEMSYTRLA